MLFGCILLIATSDAFPVIWDMVNFIMNDAKWMMNYYQQLQDERW